jgi:hypothetical protein
MLPARNPRPQQTNTNLVFAAFQRLTEASERLLRDVANGVDDSPHYDIVRDLLETVPLSTDEHALAAQRLKNAWRYAVLGENGAARYELTTLIRNFAERQRLSK